MHPELRRQPGMATRMVQEAAILEEVRHPGVVRVYECNLLEDIGRGSRWSTSMARRSPPGFKYMRTLPPLEVAKLMAEVADVLAAGPRVRRGAPRPEAR